MDIFLKRKKDILSKQDKSSRQHVDEKIAKLCEKINQKENYYTTSSCSGRIILIIESDKKEAGLFVKVYHGLISFEELKNDLNEIISSQPYSQPHPPTLKIACSLRSQNNKQLMIKKSYFGVNNLKLNINKKYSLKNKLNEISFKQEPCGLHVACRTLKDSQKFLDKAKFAGWKKSGIIASNKRFVVECFSTEKLEFPIISDGKILVVDEFLKIIVKKSNENLKRSWEKIEKLRKLI